MTIDLATLRFYARLWLSRVPMFLRPLLFIGLPLLILHPFTTIGSEDAGARERPSAVSAMTESRRAPDPIDREIVQEEVEAEAEFAEVKSAICPRRVPDRSEVIARYPIINPLQRLGYITVVSDTSRGMYEKVIDLTHEGRVALGAHTREEVDQYVIAMARRKYVPGGEHFNRYGERLSVSFTWTWEPLNDLGTRTLATDRRRGGTAIYEKSDGEWYLTQLSFADDDDRW